MIGLSPSGRRYGWWKTRPGAATGPPTRTAQGDLLFAVHAGHGEFPKLVLAPADAKDIFRQTVRAFNLADRYQVKATGISPRLYPEAYIYGLHGRALPAALGIHVTNPRLTAIVVSGEIENG